MPYRSCGIQDHMPFQRFDASLGRVFGRRPIGDPFTVTAVADARLGAAIPNVAAGRPGDFVMRRLQRGS